MGWLDKVLGQPADPRGQTAELSVTSRGGVRLAAQRIQPGVKPDRRVQARQSKRSSEQWNAYESIGEIGYVVDLFGNAMRRVRVFPAGVDDPEQGRVPLDECTWAGPNLARDALDALDRVRSVEHGQGEVLSGMAVNLKVAGIGNLIGTVDPETGLEDWQVLSTEAFTFQRGQWVIRQTPDDKRPRPVNVAAEPVWTFLQRHPRWPGLAYSEMARVLGHAENLQILERAARNRGRSRAAGAGVVVMSNRYKLNARRNPNGPQGGDVFDDFLLAGTTAMEDESAVSAFMPIMLDFDVDDARKVMHHVTFDRPLSEVEEKREDKLLRRIAQGLDAPPELITGMADLNHWCVDDSTEALTRGGWRGVDGLMVGDEVLTLNHESGLAEWAPVEDLYVAPVTGEPMVSIEQAGHSSLTTPNHRWPIVADGVRRWATSATLREQHRLTIAAPCVDVPAEAKWSDDLVELLAWYWTEGHQAGRMVSIAQSHTVNPAQVARIRSVLHRSFGPPSTSLRRSTMPAWRETTQANTSSHGGPVTVFHLNQHAAAPLIAAAPGKRVVPSLMSELTAAQLALFVDVSLQGDGQHYRSGRLDIWQRDGSMLDALEVAGIYLGHSITRVRCDGGERLTLGSHPMIRPVKAARHAARHALPGGARMETTTYTGRVWCPVTRNQTWLARRNGTVWYTGNTAWQVESSTYEAHIEPLALRIADILAITVVRSALLAAGHPVEQVARVLVGVDPSDLVRRPDPSKDADDAHGALVISDAAYRKAKGFTDDDAPEFDELLRRMALKRGITTEQLTAELLANYADADVSRTLAKGAASTARDAAAADGEEADQQASDDEPATSPDALMAAAVATLGARLQDLDDALAARVAGAAELAVAHALQRATSRVANRARGKGLRDQLAAGGRGLVHRVGVQALNDLGVDVDGLVTEGDFDDLHDQWAGWVDDTRRAGEQELSNATGQPVEADEPDVDAGWALLLAGLLGSTRRALNSDPTAPPVQQLGEADPTAVVDPGTIRSAMARTGGAQGQTTDGGAVLLDAGTRPAGGVATGEQILAAAGEAGLLLVGHTWRVGASSVPFPPHQALAGVEFTDLNDPRLANESGVFPGGARFHPQDHRGCRCTAEPRLAPISPN